MFVSSSLGILLSLVFGCLLLALVGELYYLLWWKRQRTSGHIRAEENYESDGKELFHIFCWNKKPSSIHHKNSHEIGTILASREADTDDPNIESRSSKDMLLKSFGEDSVESEIMRLHSLVGPPRFLFTINEETKEDLESEDGKSRGDMSRKGSRARSLSDIVLTIETPFLSPLPSPPLKVSSATLNHLDSYSRHGFNPLFEPSMESDFNRWRSSPPPTFKFLRDAEEKLYKRLLEEAKTEKIRDEVIGDYRIGEAKSSQKPLLLDEYIDYGDESLRKLDQNHLLQQQFHSSSSQVLPLASSPSSFSFSNKKTRSFPIED
ncbi:hypothetical protein Droror1_Dr00003290 [Drosera rotundifolia]